MKNFKIYVVALFATILVTNSCTDDNGTIPDPTPDDPKEITIKPHDFLSEETYDKLIIEIVYVDGHKPQTTAINNLLGFLNDRLNKSKGISVTYSSIPSPGKTVYSIDDLLEIEEEHRTQYPDGKTMGAWFFFADADYADNQDNSKVLGVAYRSSSMTIFEKTIQDYSGGFGQPSLTTLESTVIEHEFGHILGLVNNGTDMAENHQDTEHGRHCDNENCLMYYAVETSNFISNLAGGSIPELDQHCIDDLRKNGGK